MDEQFHQKTRIVSVVAATLMSLACGTNYAYSAWGPQLAERMQFSATQGELIGTAGNLGMYAAGVPLGTLVDRKGPRPAAVLGAICLAVGYFPIYQAYDSGAGSMGILAFLFFSCLSGVGSCAAFGAALKTAAINWPHHRGTATAFPLAAFGLSAFFFTTVSSIAFGHNTESFLLLLTVGTSGVVLISTVFLQIVHGPRAEYSVVPTSERQRRDSNQLHRTRSGGSKHMHSINEEAEDDSAPVEALEADETASLMSGPGDIIDNQDPKDSRAHNSHRLDITGFAIFRKIQFWQLFAIVGLLTGAGLMTINNIGNDVKALWTHWDDTASKPFIVQRQLLHVSIISLMSFTGRLLSGVGSDILVKKLHASRYWCLAASGTIFAFAQIAGMKVENPNYLWLVSGLNGLAYGALFGVCPAAVVDAFGPSGFSVNWGFMTMAPVVSGNIFNLCYGAIFDHHSFNSPGGERDCTAGVRCYSTAYAITFFSSLIGIAVALWSIRHEHVTKRNSEKNWQDGHREA